MHAGLFCELNNKVMLRSIDSLTRLSTSRRPHYYGEFEDLDVSTIPPEMITKLNNEGIIKYKAYWRHVIDDFFIASEYSKEELIESTKFQSNSKQQNCSIEEFSDRVHRNWNVWMKIRPRLVGDEYFVIKCFRYDSAGIVHNPEDLPYQLVEWNDEIEVWRYASFFFEQATGETLFHSDKNKVLINDEDFKNLFKWSMTNPSSANRVNSITDPFARDFLRVTLTTPRSSTMETVLQHNFFSDELDDDQRTAVKKGYFAYEKLLKQNILVQEELKQQTQCLSVISMEMQVKFEHSLWKQLAGQYEPDEVKHPTSYILLPYALEYKNGSISARVDKGPRSISLAVLDVLHYMHLLQSTKRGSNRSNKPSMQQYIDMNHHLVESQEKKPLDICRQILAIGENVEIVMSNHFGSYLSTESAKSTAHKLVSDSLRGVVNYEKCNNITNLAEQALKSVSFLIEAVGQNNENEAESMLNRHLSEMCSGYCFDVTLETKEQVYQVLLRMMKKFTEDPLLAIQSSLDSAFTCLLDNYSGEKECFVYAVDEYTGKVIINRNNPCRIQLTSDAMKAFLPTTLLLAKAHFSEGIHNFFGEHSDYIITEQNNCLIGNFSKLDAEFELSLIQNALNKNLRSKREFLCARDILDYLEDFHSNIGGRGEFFGLQRLCSPNKLIIWTETTSHNLALVEGQQALESAEVANNKSMVKYKRTFATPSSNMSDGYSSKGSLSQTSVNTEQRGQDLPLIKHVKYEAVKASIHVSEVCIENSMLWQLYF